MRGRVFPKHGRSLPPKNTWWSCVLRMFCLPHYSRHWDYTPDIRMRSSGSIFAMWWWLVSLSWSSHLNLALWNSEFAHSFAGHSWCHLWLGQIIDIGLMPSEVVRHILHLYTWQNNYLRLWWLYYTWVHWRFLIIILKFILWFTNFIAGFNDLLHPNHDFNIEPIF